MISPSFPWFAVALEQFRQAAPAGSIAFAIRAGRRERNTFQLWLRARRAVEGTADEALPLQYDGIPIEPVDRDSFLSVSGATAEGVAFEWPQPISPELSAP
jgi:hypothetical protein